MRVGRSELGFPIENYVYNHKKIRLLDIFPQQCDRRIRHRGINGIKMAILRGSCQLNRYFIFFFIFCSSNSYNAIVSCFFLQINKVRMGFNYCLGGNRVDENNMAKFQKVIRDTLKE